MDVTQPMIRSIEFERGATEQAAKGVMDPSRLIQHAETRAHSLSGEYVRNPMHVAGGRDRRRETREELADARNHLLWDTQHYLGDEDRVHRNMIALRHVCLAYRALTDDA